MATGRFFKRYSKSSQYKYVTKHTYEKGEVNKKR
jgi:hypothetical protein